jgi:hypothetical protein
MSRPRPRLRYVAASLLTGVWLLVVLVSWRIGSQSTTTIGFLFCLGTYGLYGVVACLVDWPIYAGPLCIKPLSEDHSSEVQVARAVVAVAAVVFLGYAVWSFAEGILA